MYEREREREREIKRAKGLERQRQPGRDGEPRGKSVCTMQSGND